MPSSKALTMATVAAVAVVAASCAPSSSAARSSTTVASSTTALAGALPPSPADPRAGPVGPLRAPGGPLLVDRFGRAVLLHGADLVYKVPPYEVEVSGSGPNVLSTSELQSMAADGFDAVRLGIIWKGLEPGTDPIDDPAVCRKGAPSARGPGQFDAATFDAYLQRLDATIALLGSYGIYSLIDMHQDVYNEAFGGEGAPDWAVCTDGAKPKPVLGGPDWTVNLQGPGVVTAYGHFWANDVVGNIQGEFDSLWSRIAAHYRDNPWVIGYDPLNEPYGPGLPLDNAAFDAKLQCFYVGRVHPGVNQNGRTVPCPPDDPAVGLIPDIESADPNHLVFYEGDYTTDSGPVNHIGPMPFPRLVLNFHDYCLLHIPNGPEAPNFATVCAPLENLVFTEHAAQARRDTTSEQQGGPATLLTEFGATTDAADLGRITADAEAHLVGWMYWQWLDYDDPTGSHTSGLWPPSPPTAAQLEVLDRTYAAAVAGTPTSTSFDPSSARFTLAYRADPTITEPTVVTLPLAEHYRDGYCATTTGGASVTSAPGAAHLDVVNGPNAADVTVTVTAGSC